jgi:hypothetical protein
LVKIFVGSLQFGLQPTDMCLNAFLYSSRSSAQSVFFSRQHFGDLASATDQRTQFQSYFIRQRAQRRAHGLGKRAKIWASRTSVLANCPVALAKSRT